MKIIIVPDVHGRPFWRDVLTNKEDTIVFLGDYSDPYWYEEITHEDAVRELTDIVQFKKNNPERVILLLGNHDASYIHNVFTRCRFSDELQDEYRKLFTDEPDLFQIAWGRTIDNINYLFTHAGLHLGWLKTMGSNLKKDSNVVSELNRAWKDTPEIFATVGRMRGGNSLYPSPIWADYHEHILNTNANRIQIFGHTYQGQSPILEDNMWCVDCRRVFILQNGEIEEYN